MINLLPPQEKQELQERKVQKAIIIWAFLLSLFFVSLILGLLAIKFQLSGQNVFQKTISDIAKKELNAPQNQAIKKEIDGLNQDISFIASFFQTNIRLTGILEKIVKALPPELYLNSLSYQKDNSSLTLTGFAQTREDLVLFKQNLEKEKSFSEINFPPSNWVRPTEINFLVNITFSPK